MTGTNRAAAAQWSFSIVFLINCLWIGFGAPVPAERSDSEIPAAANPPAMQNPTLSGRTGRGPFPHFWQSRPEVGAPTWFPM
jgi:hypothetical protein